VARPGNATRNDRQVTYNRWVTLVFVVLILNALEFRLVVDEHRVVLLVETSLKVLSVKDALEFAEQFKGLLDVLGLLELIFNVLLEFSLNGTDINVELDEVTIEQVLVVVKEFVVLLLELHHEVIELLEDGLNILKVVLLKSLELLNSTKQVNELLHTAAEEFELAEDLVGREVELLGFGHVLQALSSEFVLSHVGLMEFEAAVEDSNELSTRVLLTVPEGVISELGTLLDDNCLAGLELAEVQDVLLAVVDHLVGDLDKQTSHTLISVIVSSDSVNHLDTVHQGRQRLLDGHWVTFVKRFNELLKSLQVLNIIFGFVKSFSNSKVDVSPLGGSQMQLITRCSTTVTSWLGGGIENIVHGTAVLGVELLRDTSKLAHALLPVVELDSWTGFLLVLAALGFSLLEGDLDLV